MSRIEFLVQPQQSDLLHDPLELRRLLLVADRILVMSNPLVSRANFTVERDLEYLFQANLIEVVEHREIKRVTTRWLDFLERADPRELTRGIWESQRLAPATARGSSTQLEVNDSGLKLIQHRVFGDAQGLLTSGASSSLLEALAEVFWEPDEATMLAAKSGFPRARMPKFDTPINFWTRILENTQEGGVRAIIDCAAKLYPHHRVFSGLQQHIASMTFTIASFSFPDADWHPVANFLNDELEQMVDSVAVRRVASLPVGPLTAHAFRFVRWYIAAAATQDIANRRRAHLYVSRATAAALGEVSGKPLARHSLDTMQLKYSVTGTHQALLELMGSDDILRELPIQAVHQLSIELRHQKESYLRVLADLAWSKDRSLLYQVVEEVIKPVLRKIDTKADSRFRRWLRHRLWRSSSWKLWRNRYGCIGSPFATLAVSSLRTPVCPNRSNFLSSFPDLLGIARTATPDWPRIFYAIDRAGEAIALDDDYDI